MLQDSPLYRYMKERGIKPYSRESKLLGDVGVAWSFLGDIAMGKRRCSPPTLVKIQEATDGEVSAQAMIDWWMALDAATPTPASAVVHCGDGVYREDVG